MEVSSAGSCTYAGASGQAQPAKRKFFQWAVKWFYANMSEDVQEKPDAPVLACLLQSIGFQLREFEKIDESCNNEKQEVKNEGIRVIIECGTSGMRACLEMDDVKCQCPNSEDTKDASFWSVTGTGPAATVVSSNKVEESGSNLLPPVSKETKKMLSEVIYRLLGIIGDKSIDLNHNDKSHSNFNLSRVSSTRDMMDIANDVVIKNDSINIVRSHTQPEIAVTGINAARRYNWAARALVKDNICGVATGLIPKHWGETIDLDCGSIDDDQPRPSPPKIASSPVVLNQLCSSLGQISLQSEEGAGNLAEHVIRAHRSLEKAVEILFGKRSPLSRNSPNYDEGTFLKPTGGGLNLTGSVSRKQSGSSVSLRTSPTNAPNSRPGSSCSMPGRVLSTSASGKQTLSLPGKSPITRRSVGSALSKLSSTPLSSVPSTKRNIQTSTNNNAALSKIPGRRKSFGAHAGQNLKLAVAKDRNSAVTTKKTSPSSIPPEERVIVIAKRRVSPDPKSVVNTTGIQKPGSSQNSASTSALSALPTLKTAQIKTSTTTKEPSTRKSLANPKFGFSNKKT